jgi:hypothetical protein
MNALKMVTMTAALLAFVAMPAMAQQNVAVAGGKIDTTATKDSTAKAATTASTVRPIEIQYFRPQDQRGLNVFEAPKVAAAPWEGFKLSFGAAFTQQFQALEHENTASARVVNNVNQNQLVEIGEGFNNATANLYLNAQLAPGIRVALTSYLSSRHHNETWVKDGYLLVDESPLDVPALETLMKYVTLKLGHFEINYGDAHFRRTDNGNAIHNPFVGNLILDAFTTEIGGEVYVRANGFMAMGAITGGEIRGNVTRPADRSPAFIGKLGFDRQLNDDVRVRLTGSAFGQAKAINNTLYAGDRAGSRYYWVLENTQATESAQFTSGLLNPGFRSKIKAYMLNPFVKVHGLELFGVLERAEGRAANESSTRDMRQYAAEAVYRFLGNDRLFVGARYNTVQGELTGMSSDVGIDRVQFGGGWFITNNLLMKAEYVTQKYNDFPATDIRRGGKFNGFMVEGVVAF